MHCLLSSPMHPHTATWSHASVVHPMHLSLACGLHFLRVFHVAGRRHELRVVIGLCQESEPKGVAAMDFIAVAGTRSCLSIELLDSLVWSGRGQACVDSAGSGFLRNVLRI